MKQVVAIHQAMFEKLLFDEDAAVSLDLAELFHDAGKTYLQISERINETLSVSAFPSRLNIFLKPASYTLGGLFNLNSSLNQGLLLPKTSLNQSKTRRTGRVFNGRKARSGKEEPKSSSRFPTAQLTVPGACNCQAAQFPGLP